MRGTVVAVCISDVKGIQKKDVGKAMLVSNWGIEGDAHAGEHHRQVSLLSCEKVTAFNEKGAGVAHGDFGENLVLEGIDPASLPVGARVKCGQAVLEITQIGKDCHDRCQIYHKMGDCIMPREGAFARVLEGGEVCVGDVMEVLL